jgi:hypothetical protein
VPVTFVYLTGYATPDGKAHFRDDIYNLDTPAPAPEPAATGAIQPAGVAQPAATPKPKVVKPAAVKPASAKPAASKVTAVKLATEGGNPDSAPPR